MKNLTTFIEGLFRQMTRRKGQTLVEYAIILGLLGPPIIYGTMMLVDSAQTAYKNGAEPMSNPGGRLKNPEPGGGDGGEYAADEALVAVIKGPVAASYGSTVKYENNSYDRNGGTFRSVWSVKGNVTTVKKTEQYIEFVIKDKEAIEVNLTISNAGGQSATAYQETLIESSKPTAVVTTAPVEALVLDGKPVNVSIDGSYAGDGNDLTNSEWRIGSADGTKLNKSDFDDLVVNASDISGSSITYFVRVQDSSDQWSEWRSVTVRKNSKPMAQITLSKTSLLTSDELTISGSKSVDPDGDAIVAEWKLDGPSGSGDKTWNLNGTVSPSGTYTPGTYTVSLRVKDAYGSYSDWVSQSFEVRSAQGAVLPPEYESGTTNIGMTSTDDSGLTVNLQNSYNVFGRNVSSLYVSSNGIINFAGTSFNTFTNGSSSLLPDYTLAAYWDDMYVLNTSVMKKEGTDARGKYFVIEFWNLQFYSDRNVPGISFSVKVYDGGKTVISYKDLSKYPANNGAGATVGFKKTGAEYFDYSVNQAILPSDKSIHFDLR